MSEKEPESLFLPRGVIMKRNLKGVKMADPTKVTEHIDRSWYEKGKALHPYDGVTKPFKGDPKYDTNGQYSWSKAPRYEGEACEVGPLARVLVAYAYGKKDFVGVVDSTLKKTEYPGDGSLLNFGQNSCTWSGTACDWECHGRVGHGTGGKSEKRRYGHLCQMDHA